MNLPQPAIECLQNYFDRIFVITLPRLTVRHQFVAQQLKGLRYDFFYGVDKRELAGTDLGAVYNEVEAIKLERLGKGLNIGEIACALSHRMLYQEMIKNNWQKILILEDDVLALPDSLSVLPVALDELPGDWELVYLGYLLHETVTPELKRKRFFYQIASSLGLMKWSRTMVNNLLPKRYSQHLKKAGFHNCTHSYGITLAAAKKLVKNQTPVVYRADDLLSSTIMKGHLQAFITVPKFFDQQSFHEKGLDSEIKEQG